MPQPYDYSIKATAIDPSQFGSGVAAGSTISQGIIQARQAKQTLAQNETKFAQEQQAIVDAKAAAQQKSIADAAALKQKQEDISVEMSNPTVEGTRGLMTKYPELSKPYEPILASMTEEAKRGQALAAGEMYAAVINDKPEIAIALAKERAAALARDPTKGKEAQAMERMAETIERNPQAARAMLAQAVGVFGGKDAVEAATSVELMASKRAIEEAKSEQEQAKAKYALESEAAKVGLDKATAANLWSTMKYRGLQYDLDVKALAQKTAADLAQFGELPTAIGKEVSEDVASANTNDAVATRMMDLASDMESAREKAGPVGTFVSTGMTGKVAEGANRAFVTEGNFTDVRKQYTAIREKAVAAELKGQGSTTEAERGAFREGWLDEGRDPADLARDLKRRAQVLQTEAANRRGMSEFRAGNKSNGNAKTAFTTSDGFPVTPGMSQSTFSREYAGFLKGKEAAKAPAKKAPAEMTPEERAARKAEIQAELAKGAP